MAIRIKDLGPLPPDLAASLGLAPVKGGAGTGGAAPTKYRNRRTEYRGRTYDSRAEAERAAQLDALKAAGEIRHWEPQPRFRLGDEINVYVADFIVWGNDMVAWIEDCKGVETAKFRRDKLLWAKHGPCQLRVIKRGGAVEVIEGRGA